MKNLFRKKASVKEKGFSLIEVLLAIVILSLVATPILQLFITSANITRNSKELLAATDVANATMEYITGGRFDVPDTGIKAKMKEDGTKTRVPGIGLICQSVEAPGAATITSHTAFETTLRNGSITATGTKAYYVEQTDYFGIAFFNVDYDDFMFDMLVSFVPKATSSGDKFYTYDVIVDVYVIDTITDASGDPVTTNFATKIVSIDGAIANE